MAKPTAPSHLGAAARKLWAKLYTDYALDDSAGQALLQTACEAWDRAEGARVMIRKDGAVVKDRFDQLKAHPACAIERDARAQFLAAVRALRLAPEE